MIDPRIHAARQALAKGADAEVLRLLTPMLQGVRPSSDGLMLLAASLRRTGDQATAEHAMRKAEMLAPGDPRIGFEITALLVEQERFAEALTRLDRLAQSHGREPAIRQMRAAVLVHLNRFEEGLAAAESLPQSTARADVEARALLALGRRKDAAQRLASLPRLHAFKLVGGQPSGSLPLKESDLQDWLGGRIARA